MKEKELIIKIRDYLKTLDNCFCFKEHGSSYGHSGIPDLIICYRGKFIGLEVKIEKGKTSTLQEVMIRKIRNAGGIAEVVRSVDDVKKVIELLERKT